MPTMLGVCRFCRREAELKKSHTIPRWAFRRVLSRGSEPQPVLVENGTRRYSGDQDYEHLLCDECEQRFGKWDNHASRLAVQPDGASPALGAIRLLGHPQPTVENEADGTALGFDTALFAASVIWRAAVSSRGEVRLGPYRDEFRAFLNGDMPYLEHARLMIQVIDPKGGPLAAEIIGHPCTHSASGCREHQFTVPGLLFVFRVGSRVPLRYDRFCFMRTRKVWVVDGKDAARRTFRHYATATPVGNKMNKRRDR
jgi:hypothetical protein